MRLVTVDLALNALTPRARCPSRENERPALPEGPGVWMVNLLRITASVDPEGNSNARQLS